VKLYSKVLAVAAAAASAVVFSASTPRKDPLPGFPSTVLWAWERPEDLRFLTAGHTGVAFLERTLRLTAHGMRSYPRLQPLYVHPETPLMAVVRIESDGKGLPARASVVNELMEAARNPGVRALQIDFDARESERGWYRGLLHEVRNALPLELPLTITALASWCDGDDWIDGLPVADASPMLFRMGRGDYVPPSDFRVPLCRSSVGLSTDELPRRIPRGRRMFFFHPRAWTAEAYQGVVSQARLWR